MSSYLVHFTKGKGDTAKGMSASKLKRATDPGYWSTLSILSGAELQPGGPFSIGRKLAPYTEQQKVVRFSEIPPGEWLRLKCVHSIARTRVELPSGSSFQAG